MQISIPKFRSSLTPKGFNYSLTKPEVRDRQVQSTKAADNQKLFTSSGRYGINMLLYVQILNNCFKIGMIVSLNNRLGIIMCRVGLIVVVIIMGLI